MKLCPVCKAPHPDDVKTSHHPEGCPCGHWEYCGPEPRGCIWMRIVTIPADVPPALRRLYALQAQGGMIVEREQRLAGTDSKAQEPDTGAEGGLDK